MSETTGNRTAALLAAAMVRLLRDREAPKAVLAGWPEAEHGLPTSPRTLPVLRYLPLAMAYTAPETEALVAQVIADVAKLDWRQSFTAGMSERFLANYGWTEIVGPRGPIVAERLACGFLLLGPRTAFPSHRHAAEELYLPLAGTAFLNATPAMVGETLAMLVAVDWTRYRSRLVAFAEALKPRTRALFESSPLSNGSSIRPMSGAARPGRASTVYSWPLATSGKLPLASAVVEPVAE